MKNRQIRLDVGCTQVLFLVLNGHDRGKAYRITELA